jgi:hypothetical protein
MIVFETGIEGDTEQAALREVIDGQIQGGVINGSVQHILNDPGIFLEHKNFAGAKKSHGRWEI